MGSVPASSSSTSRAGQRVSEASTRSTGVSAARNEALGQAETEWRSTTSGPCPACELFSPLRLAAFRPVSRSRAAGQRSLPASPTMPVAATSSPSPPPPPPLSALAGALHQLCFAPIPHSASYRAAGCSLLPEHGTVAGACLPTNHRDDCLLTAGGCARGGPPAAAVGRCGRQAEP